MLRISMLLSVCLCLPACVANVTELSITPDVVSEPTRRESQELDDVPTTFPAAQSPTPSLIWYPPTNIPTSTVSPPSSSSPTPNYSTSLMVDDFIFTQVVPGCELPCWNGIRIGESGSEDLDIMFEKVFGFVPLNGDVFEPSPFIGLRATQYYWLFDPPNPIRDIFFLLVVQDNDQVVRGIRLTWSYAPMNNIVSVQRIIQELGEPNQVWVSSHILEGATSQALDLLIIYQSGIAFSIRRFVPIVWDNNLEKGTLELCLGGQKWGESEYIEGQAFITQPVPSERADMSSLQEELFGSDLDAFSPVPIETFFDITPEQLTDFVLRETEPCIYAVVP